MNARSAAYATLLLLGTTLPVFAAPPAPLADHGAALVAAAGLGRYALPDAELARIRGGFSLPNGISFDFGFQQITSINGTIVQRILVPMLSQFGDTVPVFVVGGSVNIGPGAGPPGTLQAGPSGQGMVTSTPLQTTLSVTTPGGTFQSDTSGQGSNGPSTPAVSTPISTVGGANSGRQYTVPLGHSAITVSTTLSGPGGNAATSIQTTLGANGVFSSINNTLSNQVIQQMTEMNINVSGLTESVAAAQAVNSVLRDAAQGTGVP